MVEKVQTEYSEIIYHTNMKLLSQWSVLKLFFDFLNENKLFMEKKGRNTEEINNGQPI